MTINVMNDYSVFVNKEIEKILLDERALRISFSGGWSIVLFDDGYQCCEIRTMRTDDDLTYHQGAKFLAMEEGKASECHEDDDVDCHEICFINVKTSKGVITISNHNEHNGYYGGFDMAVKLEKTLFSV